jgi:hypothetical protein
MTITTTARPNRFAGKCANCSQTVPAGEGILGGSRTSGWTTVHAGTCPAPVARAAAPTEVGIFVTPDAQAIRVVKAVHSDRLYTKRLVFSTFDGRTTMDWVYSPGLSVEGLPKMSDAQAAEVGLQCAQCINCLATLGGATTSAKVSAVIGYGEKCASNNGWHYPKGVRAQREFLAASGVTV